jgi:hypothetical protein
MSTTITMPTSVFVCMIAINLWIIFRDDVSPIVKSFIQRKFYHKINGVDINFKVQRKKIAELN